jgi:hypothetical protein
MWTTTIRNWFKDNEMQLTWFFIGVFGTYFVVDMGNQNYVGALLDAVIVVVNYITRPR